MGGTVLPAMNVQLVLWGAAWADESSQSPDDVAAVFGAVLSGCRAAKVGPVQGAR
jgi:hypothetical protein